MNREALPTKLNLGTMGFKHPADRSEFLKALKKATSSGFVMSSKISKRETFDMRL